MYDFKTFPDLLKYIDHDVHNEKFLSYLEGTQWVTFTSQQFVNTSRKVANAFAAKGITKGTTVAIISDSSPFWLMVDFALQELGAISVPIFANISSENLIYQIEDAEIHYMFIASQEKFDQLQEHIPKMELVVTLDVKDEADNIIHFDQFIKEASEIPAYQVEIDGDDLATIIYTSGSTGRPKGVELTHKNFMSQLIDVVQVIPLHEKHIALSFLPLAHIFERMVMSYYLASGLSVYFADDVKNVGNLIKEVRPTIMTVVPRLLDKIYTKMHENASNAKGIKWLIAKMAFSRADHKDVESAPNIVDRLSQKLVYKKLLEALGGRIDFLISGGAPLSQTTERFFTNIGVTIYQGYGLSETSPVISVNTPTDHKFGTTGKALPSVEVALMEDDELLVKGPNVMKGYHKQPEKTAQTIEDGWLHTGDLASIDAQGYITIKSRKKELFKTSTGKYVSAIVIEQSLAQSKWIEYALLVADNQPYVTALLFLDPLIIESYAQKKRLRGDTFEEYVTDPKVEKLIAAVVDQTNKHLNAWEKVKKFTLVTELPTIENHILTPSMKVSRHKAYDRYHEMIEKMYSKTEGDS